MSWKSFRFAFIAVGAAMLASCGINSVPTKEEAAKAAWANVEDAYQRRADLIPNLVSTVRGAAEAEEDTLTGVIEARSKATSIQLNADDLSDPAKFQQFEAAQGELGSALSRLMVTVERYPDLKSQGRFADLMVSLESSENRISTARTRYNEAVQDYNTTIRTFPDIVGAKVIHGAEPMQTFSAKPGADVAPTVDFGGQE
ncbi:LemA family protein [Pseudoblastomonas halimionae]|uniref:LemA family protein n=1 Tax=Alteriqipengyuania halimionae TaxID=1926630 RepID=A0A6I4TZS8_9SPHN|nr:LemA family protein [Alteriqipengyuania halimionae]MXP09006.1 LemA family protein [Alteriqipengyuania halimionae]